MTFLRRFAIPVVAVIGSMGYHTAAQQPTTPSAAVPQQIAVNVAQGVPMANQGSAPVGPLAPMAGIENAVAHLAPVQPIQPPGFPLNPVEQQFVLQTLQMWEQESSKVATFSSQFERWEYDAVFGPNRDIALIKSAGTLSFSKPDKGSFKIDAINRWTKTDPNSTAPDAPGDWVHQPEEIGEHWVCDGKAIYEYNHRDKQLRVTTIPEELRGQEIVNGPLPFLFGAKANELNNRYWIRTKQSTDSQIWLEAYPKWPSDAANYDQVDVMLDRKTMQPTAIQVWLPGKQQRHLYHLKEPKINEKNLGSWFTGLFSAPRTPLGWKKVMADQTPAGPQAANPQAPVQR